MTPQQQTTIVNVAYGKVRDSAVLSDGRRIVRTSDRISAFDMMMPFTVSGKGACLQRLSLAAFAATQDILPNHVIGTLDDRTLLVRNLHVLPIEFVVRRFLTGSLWRLVKTGGGEISDTRYGTRLVDDLGGQPLREFARFVKPICTPTTKSDTGHDQPLSVRAIPELIDSFIRERKISLRHSHRSGSDLASSIHAAVLQLFERGEALASQRGLILVDTKYEIGLTPEGEIVLADEAHTPDSSRFWTHLPTNETGPVQLSKEFLREELMRMGIIAQDDLTHSGAERLRQVGSELAVKVGERYRELERLFLGDIQESAPPSVGSRASNLPWPLPETDFAAAISPANQVRRLLIVGNGGRDHAIMSRFAQLPGLVSVACMPGERAWKARQQPVTNWTARSPEAAARSCIKDSIDLVVVGPEGPIAEGLPAALEAAHVPCLAPGPLGAALEASKVVCKTALDAAGIPTASWSTVPLSTLLTMDKPPYLPCVLKYDGLASGKGVFIIREQSDWSEAIAHCQTSQSAWMNSARNLRCPSATAEAGEPVFLIEECLEGEEYSIFALCNGSEYRLLPVARDYKRRNDEQTGPNTGGMGAVAPVPLGEDLLGQFRKAIEGILAYQKTRGEPYRGFLFGGFMVNRRGEARVLEFNCRLGDPETQVIVPGLGDDFLLECLRTAQGRPFFWSQRSGQFFNHDGLARVFLVGAAPEYPFESAPHRKLRRMEGEDVNPRSPECVLVPSAIEPDGRSCGGRAFGILARGTSIAKARVAAYSDMSAYLLGDVKPHYRRDVAAEFKEEP